MKDPRSIKDILYELADDVKDAIFGNERQYDLSRIAKKYNFKFTKRLYIEQLDVELKSLRAFSQKGSKKLENVLSRQETDLSCQILIFDSFFGSTSRTNLTSFALIDSTLFDHPHFSIRPKKASEKISEFFFLRDTFLDYRPDFNKAYRIKTNDADYINQIISDELADEMILEKNICLEGLDQYLIIYKKRNLCIPQEIPAFYELVTDFVKLFNMSTKNSKAD